MPGPIVRRLTQLLDVVGGVIGITQGGTGATSASAARTALGLQIGTNVQAFSATLAGLSSATYAAGTILGGNDDGGGVPTALTVGTGLSVSGGSLICTVSGGGGWSSDGSKATTTLLVRIGSATPPTLYNAYWLAATRDDGVSCANGFATFSDTAGNGSIRNLFRARGTSAIPAAVQTGDTIGIDQWSARNAAGSTQTVGRRVHTVSSTSFTTHPGDTETLELRVPDATSNTTVYTATGSGWTFGVPVTLTGALTGDGTTWSVGSSSGANGRLDSTSNATKGNLQLNGTNTYVGADGTFYVLSNGAANSGVEIAGGGGPPYRILIRASYSGTRPLALQAASGQTANLFEAQNSSASPLSTISENGYFTTRLNSAPADAELAAGELAWWFDSTNGAAKVMFKGKSANGTVVTGSYNLS